MSPPLAAPSPTRAPVPDDGTGLSPGVPPWDVSSRFTFQSGVQGVVLLSASKAYRLSFCVATKTTLCTAELTVRFGTQRGWVYTASSTVQEKSLPKVEVLTFEVLSAYSCVLAPSR